MPQKVLDKRLPIIPKGKNNEFFTLRRKVLIENRFVAKELICQRKDGKTVGIMSSAEHIINRKKAQKKIVNAMNATKL